MASQICVKVSHEDGMPRYRRHSLLMHMDYYCHTPFNPPLAFSISLRASHSALFCVSLHTMRSSSRMGKDAADKMERAKPKQTESTCTHPGVADKHPVYSCWGKTPPEMNVKPLLCLIDKQ